MTAKYEKFWQSSLALLEEKLWRFENYCDKYLIGVVLRDRFCSCRSERAPNSLINPLFSKKYFLCWLRKKYSILSPNCIRPFTTLKTYCVKIEKSRLVANKQPFALSAFGDAAEPTSVVEWRARRNWPKSSTHPTQGS